MLIPSELAPKWLTSPNYPQRPVKSQEQALALDCTPIERDVTAWPSDVGSPPFTVGGVYTFPDRQGHTRTAHIVTEQHAMVDGCKWHVSELPDDATLIASFTPDAETVADAARFAREVLNSQRWS